MEDGFWKSYAGFIRDWWSVIRSILLWGLIIGVILLVLIVRTHGQH